MANFRGALLLAAALSTVPVCSALLVPCSLPSVRVHSDGSFAHASRLVSLRGGAIENSPPAVMNARLGLVRVAGYGIIAGSLCLKTPQIARVWQAKSLVGLAPASIYADVFLFATSVVYHVLKQNPIRAYGESVVILLQTMVMVGLLWRFGTEEVHLSAADNIKGGVVAGDGENSGETTRGGSPDIKKRGSPQAAGGVLARRAAIVLGAGTASTLCLKYLPKSMWGFLVVVSTPTILAVQLPQMWKNWRQKHTGELALLTVLLAFIGSSIRIGTTIADLGGDPWLLFNFSLGSVTNATLLVQMWIYRARTAEVRRKVGQKAHGASPAA